VPAHAVESLDELAALAPTPVAPPRFALATWLSPCPVWQDPFVEMLPFDEPASAVTRPGTLIRVASKWFVEPVLVVAELATIRPRHGCCGEVGFGQVAEFRPLKGPLLV